MASCDRFFRCRNLIAFWTFGLCNNFAYVVMLTAAQDILNKHGKIEKVTHSVERCEPEIEHRPCSIHSASVVLLCNILPGLFIKIIYPLIATRISYGLRHAVVCLLQATSLLVVALTDSVHVALVGVIIGAISCGMGESTYLALASHYSKFTLHAWASGTGMAGVVASLAYAGMTDHRLLALSSRNAILITTIVPIIFALSYFCVLEQAETIMKSSLLRPNSWITAKNKKVSGDLVDSDAEVQTKVEKYFTKGKETLNRVYVYMIPLFIVYFSQYLINQGLFELMSVFDCSHGFGTSTRAQYRWCQVLYEIGVFVSRSSSQLLNLNMFFIQLLPILQVINLVVLLFNAVYTFIPHFGILAGIIFYEGLIAGTSYVNTYNHIHKKVDPSKRETSLAVVTIADTTGIVVAALSAMPLHNAICKIPF